jgi:hypothetical protein
MEWLTAPECALRTGLTVRALRVYENYGLITPGRQDARLMLEPIGQPVLELEQTGEADFAIPKFDLVLCFEQIENGAAQRLVIWQRGAALRLERTDDTGRAGNPNYDRMSPEFAQIAPRQLPYWQIVGQHFGAIVSIGFLRVSEQGWDIYEVQHENDVHQYRIAMGDDGKVYGFSEASATAEKLALA